MLTTILIKAKEYVTIKNMGIFKETSREQHVFLRNNQEVHEDSKENLSKDEFLRKRMDDEGFVHIQFIAGFRKVKFLYSYILFYIMVSCMFLFVQIELYGYEIRNRLNWKSYLMPHHLRVAFNPSVEHDLTKVDETSPS
ncbi:unnamed protein product [Cochlearia groenlandica]